MVEAYVCNVVKRNSEIKIHLGKKIGQRCIVFKIYVNLL